MKSFFTKLGKLLLCGVAVAVVGCTDFSEDIKAVGDKVDALEQQTAADIQKAIADLQASIDSKFATKEALAALESDLEGEISSQIASLKSTLETAINQKADKATVEAEFLIVKEDLADLEAALATAKAELQAEIAKKADQTALDAALVRVSALETTVAGLSTDVASLITMIQQHDYAITNLTGFQQTATEKLADLEAQDKALKALIESEVEDLYAEIETVEEFASAIERLYKEADAELWAKLNELDADVWKKVEVLEGSISVVNNLLKLEAEERANEDTQLQQQINTALESISAVYTLLADNRAELDAKDLKLENEINILITTTNTLTETISAVNLKVDGVQSALNAHIDAAAAYKKSLEETLEALKTAAGNHDFAITNINTLLEEAVKDIEVLVSEDVKIKEQVAQIYEIVTNYATRLETNEGAIEDLQEENKEIKEQIAQHLTVITNNAKSIETLTGNVEDLLAADKVIKTTISQLESAVTNLTYGSATKEELNELRGDLNKQVETINAAIKAANARIDELFNLIDDLTGRVEALEEVKDQLLDDIDALKAEDAALADSLKAYYDDAIAAIEEVEKDLNNANNVQDGKINNLTTALATLRAQFDERMQHYDSFENDTANKIKELQDNLAAAEIKINDLFNLIVNDLNGRIQSVVFVPNHSDLKASGTVYTYADNKEQVIVRATYQVTPANHVAKIGTELEVIGALQAVESRAAADEYLFAEAAYITDVNLNNGKFDVEYVFDAEDFDALVSNEGKRPQEDQDYMTRCVLGTFVQHPECVMPAEDVDDEMGIATETLFKNYKVSDFAAVNVDEINLNYDYYVLTKETEKGYVDYTTINDKVAWSTATPDRKPFENYDVMIKGLEGLDEYATLEEVADYLRLYDAEGKPNKAIITPAYKYENKYYWADPQTDAFKAEPLNAAYTEETTCTGVHEVTGTDLYKTFSIAIKNPKNENAEDLIGHKLAHHVDFYFGPAAAPTAIVIVADYNYIIDYRTYVYNLVGGAAQHRIDWTYELANALADKVDPADVKTWEANAKEMHGDETRKTDPYFVENFTEYDIIPAETNEGEPVDYKATIKNFKAVRTVKASATVKKEPKLHIMPRTGIIHDIAAVRIEGGSYEFIEKDVLYNFTNTHTDDSLTYTKVQFNYDLTLGHMPLEVAVTTPVETIKYKGRDNWTKTFDFSALTAQAPELAGHGFGTAYNPITDNTHGGKSQLYASETPAKEIATNGSAIGVQSGNVTVTPKAQQDIFNNEAAKSSGYLTRTVTTWYGTQFIYKVPFTVVAPAYKLDINPLHVAEDTDGYYATANYVYADDENRTYTVVNSFMQDYFRVLNFDKENELTVNFQIISKDANDKSTPKFLDNSRVPKYTNITKDVIVGGTFKRDKSELAWDDYHYTSVDVVAQLLVNGVAFGDPVKVTILAQDPLELRGAEVVKNWVANEDLPIEDVLSGAEVTVIDQTNYLYAHKFAANTYNSYYNKAKAYDAKFTVEKVKVYFFENDGETKTDVPAQYYSYDTQTRKLVFKKETADLMTAIFAEFDVTMDYTLDCDEPETVKVVYKVPAVEK